MLRKCEICGKLFKQEGSNLKVCEVCALLNYKKGKLKHKGKPRNKGARLINSKGYVLVYFPHHPMAAKSGYVLEHRIVMAQHLKRILKRNEVVHHINGNKRDNRIENLELINYHEHNRHHSQKNLKA